MIGLLTGSMMLLVSSAARAFGIRGSGRSWEVYALPRIQFSQIGQERQQEEHDTFL